MKLTRDQLQRLRHRHMGYRLTLCAEVLLLLLLPLAQQHNGLLSLLLIGLALELVAFVSRYSSLRATRPLVYGLGGLAVVLEVLWQTSLRFSPSLGQLLTVPHVLVWVLFLLVAVVRKVKTLIREPYVTVSVVLGAASGYLLVGIAGGVLLTALWVLQPAAFDAASLPLAPVTAADPVPVSPALMAASFGLLTTVGTGVLSPANVTAQVIASVITIAGQLYVAILIALILGRFHQRGG
ncbi:MAG: hypothetical protein EBX49_05295 [Synechococcaceae bacterium WB8_1B_136]|nr:hypothetical protein [Synechococcaceae bacterium WB8_1B_136]